MGRYRTYNQGKAHRQCATGMRASADERRIDAARLSKGLKEGDYAKIRLVIKKKGYMDAVKILPKNDHGQFVLEGYSGGFTESELEWAEPPKKE